MKLHCGACGKRIRNFFDDMGVVCDSRAKLAEGEYGVCSDCDALLVFEHGRLRAIRQGEMVPQDVETAARQRIRQNRVTRELKARRN